MERSPHGAVLVAVFAAPHAGGCRPRRGRDEPRRSDNSELRLPLPRAGMAWRVARRHQRRRMRAGTPARGRRPRRAPRALLAHARREPAAPGARAASAAPARTHRRARRRRRNRRRMVGRRRRTHTIVSPETKIAPARRSGLPAPARRRRARASPRRSTRRAAPAAATRWSLRARRAAPAPPARRRGRQARRPGSSVRTEPSIDGGSTLDEGARLELPDGREVIERMSSCRTLPIGRHRLDGRPRRLPADRRAARRPIGPRRRRRNASASPRNSTRCAARPGRAIRASATSPTLAIAGAAAGRAGAAYLGVSPMHMLFPRDRERGSPYHPSDRRFLDPILIDVLDGSGLPRDEALDAELAALGQRSAPPRRRNSSATRRSGASSAPRWKRAMRRSPAPAPRGPGEPIFADFAAFVGAGGEALRRFAAFQAIAAARSRRELARVAAEHCATPTRRRSRMRSPATMTRVRLRRSSASGSPTVSSAGAAARARAAGLEIGFYRDLAVGAAPDGAEAWAHARRAGAGRRRWRAARPFSRRRGRTGTCRRPIRSPAPAKDGTN